MSLAGPEEFPRAFAAAFAARDPAGVAALFAEDADFLTLTGAWAEGQTAIAEVLAGELAGALARARLVTGRGRIRPIGPGGAVMLQRFVLSGIRHPDGSEAGRVGAVLMATLLATREGWRAAAASFTAEG